MITGGMLGVVSDKKEGTRGTDRAHAGHRAQLQTTTHTQPLKYTENRTEYTTMGNLLGSPITTKDTHVGHTHTSKLAYGISSMQGWRIHMEDAHIAQPFLFAEKKMADVSSRFGTIVSVCHYYFDVV